jgi:uncharacterized membrane protein YgcG
MTLTNGRPGAGHPVLHPSRPSGPFPAPPPGAVPPPRSAPSGGSPAQSPGTPTPGRWRRLWDAANRRPALYGVLTVLSLLEAFVLFSAAMWWLGPWPVLGSATVTPVTVTGVVYDVGAAGVNLRSAPQVSADDARDTAARGSRLALVCGQTGAVVSKGSVQTATWVKTADGLWVSMLYVHVPGQASIPSCDGSADGSAIALADPANPQQPPPPGTKAGTTGGEPNAVSTQASGRGGDGTSSSGGGGGTSHAAGGAPVPQAPGGGGAPAAQHDAASPAVPNAGAGTPSAGPTTTTTAAAPAPGGTAAHSATAHDPDTVPVG